VDLGDVEEYRWNSVEYRSWSQTYVVTADHNVGDSCGAGRGGAGSGGWGNLQAFKKTYTKVQYDALKVWHLLHCLCGTCSTARSPVLTRPSHPIPCPYPLSPPRSSLDYLPSPPVRPPATRSA
jgi:hypothetical protein